VATNTGPQITIGRKSGAAALAARLAGLTRLGAYVGVPAAGGGARQRQLLEMAGKTKSKKKKAKLEKAAAGDVNNAELLFIHEHGSPINKIPARRVLGPSVEADGNKQAIANELSKSVRSRLAGDKEGAEKNMMRAAIAGQNAARKWFTDPRNGWAPNKPSTVRRKGSSQPLIDTGALRASIVGVVREE
jgi:hypothetical protein